MTLKDWLIFIGPLAGALIGGGIAYFASWQQFRRQINRDDRILLRANLAELHFLISDYLIVCSHFVKRASLISFANAKAVDAEALFNALQKPMSKIHSLQQLHATELSEDWFNLVNAAEKLIPEAGSLFNGKESFTELK